MKGFSFPLFKTKSRGGPSAFRLEDPVERRKYFELKAGREIEKLRDYLRGNTFVGFLLGKKNSGKGTYSKLFMEAVGPEHVGHLSIGDIVRGVHEDFRDDVKKKELLDFLEKRYRGFLPINKAIDALLGRNPTTLLPTELILALVEREIDRMGEKAVFIDGFPRNLDQISYSLYFRALIGYRDDPDFFIFIDVPDIIIDERMRYRVVCPQCETPRNTKLLRTPEVRYDPLKKAFYLLCDNPNCSGLGKERMISKEGDDLGIEVIRERIEADEKVMRTLLDLEGVPKIFLRNSIPVSMANEYVDEYEITPAYQYQWDEVAQKVQVIEKPWVVNGDTGELLYSLLPAPVAVSMIKQIADVLGPTF